MSTSTIQVQVGSPATGWSSQYTSTVLLEGRRYAFSFYTNKLSGDAGAWFFDVLNPVDLSVAVGGIGLAIGLSLLYPYRYKGVSIIPPGTLYVQDIAGRMADPALETFELGQARLLYTSADEVTPF
jgi:hypothetical protein